MTTLNRAGADAMLACDARAATDVTGFGLLGHLAGMLRGGGLDAEIDFGAVPFLPGVREAAAAGMVPGGSRTNLRTFGALTDFESEIAEPDRLALADAQTSGGLLIACPPERADELAARLRDAATPAAARIGRLAAGTGRIRVRA